MLRLVQGLVVGVLGRGSWEGARRGGCTLARVWTSRGWGRHVDGETVGPSYAYGTAVRRRGCSRTARPLTSPRHHYYHHHRHGDLSSPLPPPFHSQDEWVRKNLEAEAAGSGRGRPYIPPAPTKAVLGHSYGASRYLQPPNNEEPWKMSKFKTVGPKVTQYSGGSVRASRTAPADGDEYAAAEAPAE